MLLYLAIGFYGNIMFLLYKKNLKINISEQSNGAHILANAD